MEQPAVDLNYLYQNKRRDVSSVLALVTQSQPTLVSIIERAPYRAQSHKFEWPELALAAESTTTTADITNSATTLPVVSNAPFVANTIIRFEGSDEIARVTNADTVSMTIVRGYGGTAAAAVVSGKRVYVVSKPKHEGSVPQFTKNATAPAMNYNYTEIFDFEAVASKSKERLYGVSADSTDPVGDLLNFKVQLEMVGVSRRINNSLIHGRRSERTSSIPGTMGGILQYHVGGNNVAAAGAPVSRKMLGDAFQKCFDGGATQLDTILCGAAQARNISALYAGKLMILREDTTLGNRILRVQPDMPIEGYVSTIVVDPNYPPDKISIFAKGNIKLVDQRPMTDEDSAPKAADFVSRRGVAEMTAEFNSFGETSCLISDLDTTIVDPDAE
ncbi:DUF5309 family protein [Candidatus Sumerlaeota bacterium]|nr:DUF5309 family protein [Candidatus Sumerlaeota bacterium]